MKHRRARFQHGSLTSEYRKDGPPVWVYRWREIGPNGESTRRKKNVGPKSQFGSRTAALRAVEALKLDINAEVTSTSWTKMTVGQLIEHYRQTELSESSSKTMRTKQVYEHQLLHVISPRWGKHQLNDVRPIAVEKWLNEMHLAPGSKVKTKGVMSVLFQHGMRYGWATTNPIRLVRQGGTSLQEQIVLSPVEIAALLDQLRDPFYTLILLVYLTGLRRGELFGLKWEDVDFHQAEIRIVRSIVDQVEGPPKTLASRKPIPMSSQLADRLERWKKQTSFPDSRDWIFASPLAIGAKPYWPDAVLKRHVLPAADRAGIVKKIGWHSFRRTLAAVLQSSGATVKTTQDLLRHSSPVMTLGTYAKSVTQEKRDAQDAVAALFLAELEEEVPA